MSFHFYSPVSITSIICCICHLFNKAIPTDYIGFLFRSGLLHVGDHVLSIDGIELDGKTEEEAADILEKCSNVVVQLLIYPASVVAKQSALLSGKPMRCILRTAVALYRDFDF